MAKADGDGVLRRISRRLDRGLLPFMGPAQLGAGHEETPYRADAGAACPICGAPMTEHRIERSADQTHSTRLFCPPAAEVSAARPRTP
jgi:hypothetical protein